ncbi:MAG: F0F1 ATP synthase subunit B [Alphaproteobacteria bacterium]|jgi:F-type H+-transporting ATPase subunit b|nr:F0F1 ATP synthase subunit B [Alphaproteobacteria bacterium]MDP7191107.1 F0F1 ATP synthase subunit B [Alphaproteobacteria bacterium]HJO88266.1 F0F1 ATP synthase subunit B [Alphaproteobacteria bacterium]|tara:strand:- start:253 stop:735 length:483 start_codon:yes stop_codon:yes gene_type:complete
MLESAEFWVAVAFIAFVAGAIKPGRKAILEALDNRAVKIGAEIDEVTRLREEAQAELAENLRKQRETAEETEDILEHAKEEADLLCKHTVSDLEDALERRERQALNHITQAEAEATKEIRDHAVDIAVTATLRILEENLDEERGNDLIEAAIEELPKKLH